MSQPRTPTRPATYKDILSLPDHVVGEIVDGELFVSPRPAPRHARAGSAIGFALGPPFDHGQYFTTAPDWICEVLSPSTARLDRHRKLGVYAQAGVAHAWLVDPIARTLEVLRLDGGHWIIDAVHSGDDTVQAQPFDAIAVPIARWWAD